MKTNNIQKVLTILEAFLKHEEGEIGLNTLAELTGLNVSTIHRIASVLVENGYLSQPHQRGKYSLGPKFLQFGALTTKRIKVTEVAFPLLVRLNRVVNESTNLAILESDEAVYAQRIEPVQTGHQLQIFTQVGARVPLYCTGVGKVLLANVSEEERERYLGNNRFAKRTKNTITDHVKLQRELSAVRRRGFAIDDEEMELGVRCIAAPIRDFEGKVVAAVSVSGPSTRLSDERIQQLEPLLKSCASDISKAAGYRGE